MSVRAGLLLVLGETDAYGLQLHGALEARTDRVGAINVGQVYSTLERLVAAGLVRTAGSTADGLPLYGVTADGRAEADRWLADVDVMAPSAWPDMVFKVLLALSLTGADSSGLLTRYRSAWTGLLGDSGEPLGDGPTEPNAASAAALARRELARSAVRWLDALKAQPGGLDALRVPLRNERPRRGRRPSSAAGPAAGVAVAAAAAASPLP
jgi:DNA-binding PadR family transcriptional regulator